jgi:hypothetical protein
LGTFLASPPPSSDKAIQSISNFAFNDKQTKVSEREVAAAVFGEVNSAHENAYSTLRGEKKMRSHFMPREQARTAHEKRRKHLHT